MPSLPGRRPCSNPGPATTRAKNIAGRVGGGLVAAVTLAGLALPAALLLSTGTAVAAATQAKAVTTAVTMTGMSPKWATARSVITVSGLVTNTSKVAVRGWGVQLYASATPVTSPTVIGPNTVPFYEFAGIQPLAGARWRSHQIQPGHSVRWTIRVRARKIGMTQFGVYPLAAVALNRAGTALGASTSYLPYIPRKKGAYSASRPAREQISWVWPLIDKPMLGPPWQNACTGPQARALADSLRPGGRLANLVAAGRGSRGITWAVDPALLADAKSLTGCRSRDPGLARAAVAWLASVSAATAGQPLFAMPYGDPNAAALIRQNHLGDVKNAFRLGRNLASRILHRNLVPASSRRQAGAGSQATGIAWLADGGADYATIEDLAGYQIRVRTVVLSHSALPEVPGAVAHLSNGAGTYTTLLLSNDSLGSLLGSADDGPGSAFASSQAFLAETALIAAQQPGQPIVIAPPARWNPAARLAARVLADTASAPWLRPVSLTALASKSSIHRIASLPQRSPGGHSYPRQELAELRQLGQRISQLVSIQAVPKPDLYLAISAIESSAWNGKAYKTARVMLKTLQTTLDQQQGRVQIVAGKAGIRITLGGLKGSVPVSINNRLGFAIKVKMRLSYDAATGVKIAEDPAVVTIPARSPRTIRLHVQAAQVGSTTITMRVENQRGQLLPSAPARMTVQATQVGVLGMIIFACALGVFLIASAARAVRHGRPGPAGPAAPQDAPLPDGMGSDQAGSKVPGGEAAPADVPEGGELAGEPATVVPEHSELGAAGPPRL